MLIHLNVWRCTDLQALNENNDNDDYDVDDDDNDDDKDKSIQFTSLRAY